MSMVVKIGGVLLQDTAKAAAALRSVIHGPAVVVHGGGIQITQMIERMKLKSEFVEGLRVTDSQTLHAVCLALLGEVHTQLVQSMQAAGLNAVGVFGLIQAKRKTGPWGLVGTDVKSDAGTFKALLAQDKVPVVPTLAVNLETLLNVNGDETAAALAVDLGAERLVFMTDVPGVLDGDRKVMDRVLSVDELLASSFVSGGMVPKLRAVKTALSGGVPLALVGQTIFEGVS
jgi:acetylglutamate kinase